MSPTPSEVSIKRSLRAKGVLVPLLEDLLRDPVEPEDEEDFQFLDQLVRARGRKRKSGIYSPSMLASCVRQVYFVKQGEKQKRAKNKRTHGFFLNGNFIHFKWQFALWKLHRAGKLELLGVEVFVQSKKGDWGGTLDAIVRINGAVYIVDIKGRETNAFLKILAEGGPLQYHVQITGYAMLTSEIGHGEIPKAIMLYENKNGPARVRNASPIALHEEIVEVDKYRKTVSSRLERLRDYERREEIPPIECETTSSQKFLECPFFHICRGEIERYERKVKRENRDTAKPRPRVSRPKRADNSKRRVSKRGRG